MPEKRSSKISALINSSDGLIIAAGAGMGVDSGLPDFRGNEGMWQHY
ncbi:MAG: NAD-dependent deacetylase, partial [Agitococcus sp.]|nr:NAD-dependent deacetylase [Agitococcus sp.]